MQQFFCIGNLTKDPEIRAAANGVEYALFTVAVRRGYTTPDGKPITDFFNCVAWRSIGKLVKTYCGKGSRVAIIGELQNHAYEKDGVKNVKCEINVNTIKFLSYNEQADTSISNTVDRATPKAVPQSQLSLMSDDGTLPF